MKIRLMHMHYNGWQLIERDYPTNNKYQH